MDMQEFLKNRSAFPPDELAKYRGRWIAWSPDGTRIVANAPSREALDDLVRLAGENPEECPTEGIPDADTALGG